MGKERRVALKLNTWSLPLLVGLLLLLQVFVPFKGWVILLVGLGGVLAICYGWARLLASGVSFVREVRFGWAQVGDRVEERFTLVNDSPLPALWVEVVDGSTLPGYGFNWGTGIDGRQTVRWTRRAVCTRRGLYVLGPTRLVMGDPFGLFTITQTYTASIPFLVMPPVVPLPAIQISPGGRMGEGRPRPDAPDRSVSVSSVREYVPGDSLRWVHWPTTARRGSLYVRLFDGTPAADWWILLDLDRGVQAGEEENSTEEHGIILAASLAHHGLETRRNVGLVAQGEDLAWFAPRGGLANRWEILRALALINPGRRPLADLLSQTGPALGRQASLLIITPSTEAEWVEALVPLLGRGLVPTVLLLDPASFGGKGDVSGMAGMLTDLGVAYEIVGRDLLDRPEARPGVRGHWEWRILGSGRALPVRRPGDLTWRVLS